MGCGTECSKREAGLGTNYGVHRTFKQWGDWRGVGKAAQQDHAANRLPWISVKPPSGGAAAGWRAVASGSMDAQIRQLADVLKANDDDPILITFHHEPSNDGSESQGALWAAAYSRFHDVLKSSGALQNVSDPPILGDWLFNPRNGGQDPKNWLTNGVLSRAPFMGIDMYENPNNTEGFATRIPAIIKWIADRGFPNMMVGIGETGSTDHYKGISAVKWLNDGLKWASANPDKVGVIAYYNTEANSRAGVYWPLDESPAKLAAYKSWLGNSNIAASL